MRPSGDKVLQNQHQYLNTGQGVTVLLGRSQTDLADAAGSSRPAR